MPALGHTSSGTAEVERKAFARAPHRSSRSYSDEVRGQESHVVAWFGQGDRADGEIMSVLPDSERLSSGCSSTSLDMAVEAMAKSTLGLCWTVPGSHVPCRCGCLFQVVRGQDSLQDHCDENSQRVTGMVCSPWRPGTSRDR